MNLNILPNYLLKLFPERATHNNIQRVTHFSHLPRIGKHKNPKFNKSYLCMTLKQKTTLSSFKYALKQKYLTQH